MRCRHVGHRILHHPYVLEQSDQGMRRPRLVGAWPPDAAVPGYESEIRKPGRPDWCSRGMQERVRMKSRKHRKEIGLSVIGYTLHCVERFLWELARNLETRLRIAGIELYGFSSPLCLLGRPCRIYVCFRLKAEPVNEPVSREASRHCRSLSYASRDEAAKTKATSQISGAFLFSESQIFRASAGARFGIFSNQLNSCPGSEIITNMLSLRSCLS